MGPATADAGRAAARTIWLDGLGVVDEPENVGFEYAYAALEEIAVCVRGRSAVDRLSAEGAERGAVSLSGDALQGLAEVIQNADDQGAKNVSLMLRAGERNRQDLLVVHDGRPVQLDHVVAMAFPWITTKSDDASATGRFGIGLKTLNSLGGPLRVDCSPYHVELRGQTVFPVAPATPIASFYDPSLRETLLTLPLSVSLGPDEIASWLRGIGPSGLVFMRSVQTVHLVDERCNDLGFIDVRPVGDRAAVTLAIGEKSILASLDRLMDSAGVSWERYSTEVAVPDGLHRQSKANGMRTTVEVAFPDAPMECRVHTALPVEVTGLPFAINGQFDPETGRQHLLATEWNRWLFRETASLTAAIAAGRLRARKPEAWAAIPLVGDLAPSAQVLTSVLRQHLVEPARAALIIDATIPFGDEDTVTLAELDYEVPALESLLSDSEVRSLVGEHAVPLAVDQRDGRQRWRAVLAEFGVQPAVTVVSALNLFKSDELNWGPAWYAALTEIALVNPAANSLVASYPCVVLADGTRRPPVARNTGAVLVEVLDETSLAARLQLALPVDSDYISASDAVAKWLRARGSLVARHDSPGALVASLAETGTVVNLRSADVRELRDAFDGLSDEDRRRFGPPVGRRIAVPCRHAVNAQWEKKWASPARAYLPASIEKAKDSWARAAGKTPGLLWLAPEVGDALKGAGREASGSMKFLKLLGAATGPRLHEPKGTSPHFRRNLERVTPISPSACPPSQLQQIDAAPHTHTTHLRGDRASDDLAAVCRNISSGKRNERAPRARALLSTLSRGWTEYHDYVTAEAVFAYDGQYLPRRIVISSWLADLQDVAWIPTGRGAAQRPPDTALRTSATELVYGKDPASFVVAGVAEGQRPDVLRAVGVRLDPAASTLVQQLADLRKEEGSTTTPREGVAEECRSLYRLLAEHTRRTGPGGGAGRVDDISIGELRRLFTTGVGLVRTSVGWRQPGSVLRGRPIFGRHRAWAPGGSDTLPLWTALQIPESRASDCIAVIQEIAQAGSLRADDEGVLLESFERLVDLADTLDESSRSELRRLPLWSGTRWLRARPVALLDDSALAGALPTGTAIWIHPLPLPRLRPLLEALRVHAIETATLDSHAGGPLAQVLGEPLRRQFARACQHLSAELPRTDVGLAKTARVDLAQLGLAPVFLVPGLTVRVPHPAGPLDIRVRAHVRLDPLAWLVADEDAGGAEGGAGAAVARLFDGDRQKVAWAWSAMWQKAGTDAAPAAHAPTLSRESDEEIDPLQALVSTAPDRSRARAAQSKSSPQPAPTSVSASPIVESPSAGGAANGVTRTLKDASTMVIERASLLRPGKTPSGVRVPKRRGLRDLMQPLPKPTETASATLAGVDYTTGEKEALALAALRQLLDASPEDLVDVTALRGIGADALDRANRPFELKTAGREMPDQVSLTANEAERAATTPGFCLVVVAGLEEGQRTEIVVVVDPLLTLPLQFNGGVSVGDLRARSRPVPTEPPAVAS